MMVRAAHLVLHSTYRALFAIAGTLIACGGGDPGPEPAGRGAELFAEHCAVCHGSDADGTGPLARGLAFQPADLTRIAARAGGTFPEEAVRSTIDGRAVRGGHRNSEMPRWGEFFGDPGISEEAVSRNIEALVAYVASVQRLEVAPASTTERMTHLAQAVERALPVAFSDVALGSEDQRRAFQDAVAFLGANAVQLEQHAAAATFAPLARSLARDAERTHAALEAGQVRRARYRFGELLENCAACHARTRDPDLLGGWDFDERVVAGFDFRALHPHEELRLLLATRRFEAAQDRYEALLLGPGEAVIDRRGLLTDYLIVSIRVMGDLDRPTRFLEELAESATPARALELRRWRASLESLHPEGAAQSPATSLERARALLERAAVARTDTEPDAGLVYDIAASGYLTRFVESGPEPGPTLAEAYLLLGLTETRIQRPTGRERWDDFLEAAIRLDPDSPTSRAAFELYQENRVRTYGGRPIMVLPRAELARVDELRGLAFGGER